MRFAKQNIRSNQRFLVPRRVGSFEKELSAAKRLTEDCILPQAKCMK